MPTAASAEQLRARVESGIKLGLVNTAEVLLARAKGVPVKIVAGYFGPTSAKLYVKADGPIRTPKDLDGRRVGILATTHTSYRTISYMNAKLGLKTEPVPLGAFVQVTLAAVKYLRENPTQAADLLTRRTNAPKDVASRIVAELNKVLTPTGRGSDQDLVAAVAGSWRFTVESGAVTAPTAAPPYAPGRPTA